MTAKELELKDKKELQTQGESTYDCKFYQPEVDIFETENEIMVFADLAGVDKEEVNVTLENGLLTLKGEIQPKEYENLTPVYLEYNVGHYFRQFQLGKDVDQNSIEASMKDGVLGLRIKKAEKAKPRKIAVS